MLPSNLPTLSATEIVPLAGPALPDDVLAQWRAELDEMAALPDALQRNDRISQFLTPLKVGHIEEAEDAPLLAAACRATRHLSNEEARRAVVTGLLTDHSIHAVGQCDDAAILHDVSQAMQALEPEHHAGALNGLLTAQGVLDTLTRDVRIDLVADLAHDAATWLHRDDTLEWVMGELMTNDVLKAAMASGRPDLIGKIAFAACALSEERRASVLGRLVQADPSGAATLTWQQILAQAAVGVPIDGSTHSRASRPAGPAP